MRNASHGQSRVDARRCPLCRQIEVGFGKASSLPTPRSGDPRDEQTHRVVGGPHSPPWRDITAHEPLAIGGPGRLSTQPSAAETRRLRLPHKRRERQTHFLRRLSVAVMLIARFDGDVEELKQAYDRAHRLIMERPGPPIGELRRERRRPAPHRRVGVRGAPADAVRESRVRGDADISGLSVAHHCRHHDPAAPRHGASSVTRD